MFDFCIPSYRFHGEQECCYGNGGNLIAGIPNGGTTKRVSKAINRVEHFWEEVRPFLLCCGGLAPNCGLYFDRRPSDNGSRFNPPTPGVSWLCEMVACTMGHHYYIYLLPSINVYITILCVLISDIMGTNCFFIEVFHLPQSYIPTTSTSHDFGS